MFTATTTNRKGDKHHFFASSAATWQTGEDVAALVTKMKREPYAFNLWYVPKPLNADYQIAAFSPQVEGAVWLGFYQFASK